MDWESSSCCEVHGDKSSSCQEKVERWCYQDAEEVFISYLKVKVAFMRKIRGS